MALAVVLRPEVPLVMVVDRALGILRLTGGSFGLQEADGNTGYS